MTMLLLLLTSLISGLAIGDDTCSREFDVLIRGKKSNYSFEKKTLTDLKCNNTFEGKYFKIIEGTGDQAIKFTDNKDLIKKAANVYYHLTLARDYWINKVKSEHVKNLETIIIRLEIVNNYSRVRHFKNENLDPHYNYVWTTPAGQDFKVKDRKWNEEIWFSPLKKLATREEMKSTGKNPVHESLTLIKDPVVDFAGTSLFYNTLGYLAFPKRYNGSTYLDNAIIQIGTMAAVYGLIETTKHMDKWFVNKYYYIETTMVPDIIYHEFAHVAMADTLKPVHSMPLIEGMADYFATLIVDRDKMYQPLKGISTNRVKKRNNKSFYHPYQEAKWNNESDFTLSLLWDVHQKFTELNLTRLKQKKKILADPTQLIYKAHFKLTEQSNIREDLTKALIETCSEICANTRLGISEIHRVLEQKGFN